MVVVVKHSALPYLGLRMGGGTFASVCVALAATEIMLALAGRHSEKGLKDVIRAKRGLTAARPAKEPLAEPHLNASDELIRVMNMSRAQEAPSQRLLFAFPFAPLPPPEEPPGSKTISRPEQVAPQRPPKGKSSPPRVAPQALPKVPAAKFGPWKGNEFGLPTRLFPEEAPPFLVPSGEVAEAGMMRIQDLDAAAVKARQAFVRRELIALNIQFWGNLLVGGADPDSGDSFAQIMQKMIDSMPWTNKTSEGYVAPLWLSAWTREVAIDTKEIPSLQLRYWYDVLARGDLDASDAFWKNMILDVDADLENVASVYQGTDTLFTEMERVEEAREAVKKVQAAQDVLTEARNQLAAKKKTMAWVRDQTGDVLATDIASDWVTDEHVGTDPGRMYADRDAESQLEVAAAERRVRSKEFIHMRAVKEAAQLLTEANVLTFTGDSRDRPTAPDFSAERL